MERSARNVVFSCLTILAVIVLCLGALGLAGVGLYFI
jgi:hypothetical protein